MCMRASVHVRARVRACLPVCYRACFVLGDVLSEGGRLQQVLDRGERIELLVDKTEHLQAEAFTFKREARRLKTRMWWKNWRMLVAVFALLLLVLYGIVCVVCSPTFHCT